MKKLMKILIVLLVFSLTNPLELYSQNVVSKKDTIIPDEKFWFSEIQLLEAANFAIQTNRSFFRYYVNGVEYTEWGYTKLSAYKDSKLVARINTQYEGVKILSVNSNPYRLGISFNARFTKY